MKIIRTYTEAEAHCSNIGGHVVALETEEESEAVREMFQAPTGTIYIHGKEGLTNLLTCRYSTEMLANVYIDINCKEKSL